MSQKQSSYFFLIKINIEYTINSLDFCKVQRVFLWYIFKKSVYENEKVKEIVGKHHIPFKKLNQLKNSSKAIKELIQNDQKNAFKTPHRHFPRETLSRKRNKKTQSMYSFLI